MNTPRRRQAIFTVAAFLVAPLVAAFGLALAGLVKTDSAHINFEEVAVWTFIFYLYAAYAAFLLGLPSFLVLRRLGAIRWWSATLVGLLVGVAVFAFIEPRGFSAIASVPYQAALWASIGGLSAFVFWLVWRQGLGSSLNQP